MNKAHGWDQFSIRMIKVCGNAISLPLKVIFKSMINEGVFPEDWKKSNVVPIYKKESKNLIKNYGPTSLLPVFRKVFERLVLMRCLTSFCEINCSLPVNLASYLVTPVFPNYYQSRMKFTKASIATHPLV